MSKLKITASGPVLSVQLNRPEVHNAFDAEQIENLTQAFSNASKDENIRMVVLSGEGKNFCAGADIRWMKDTVDFSEKENQEDAYKLHQMLETIYQCSKPTIARLTGAVLGGGVGLTACVDVAIASDSTFLSLSETRLGILPATISPFVIRKIGLGAFRAYGLSAKRMTAQEALRLGLVQEIASLETIDSSVQEWTKEFLQNGPKAMSLLKDLSDRIYGKPLKEASLHTAKTIAKARVSQEGQEGLRAFLEKRKPSWRM